MSCASVNTQMYKYKLKQYLTQLDRSKNNVVPFKLIQSERDNNIHIAIVDN